jgi:hypothetical protein
MLRARQALRSHAHTTIASTIRIWPYSPARDKLARRWFFGGVRSTGCTRVFDRAVERCTRQRARLHAP